MRGVLVGPVLLIAFAAWTFAHGGALLGVRSSSSGALRIVLDLEGVASDALQALERGGRVTLGAPLELQVPATASAEATLPDRVDDVALTWVAAAGATALTVAHRDAGFRVFALTDPPRLVIDLWRAPRPEEEALWAPGVRYQRTTASGSAGASVVHAVWVAPGAGQWAVVGTPGERRATSAWAEGALLGINGGYFDVRSGEPIGWLVQSGLRLGEPSRGRAAIAFDATGAATIARVQEAIGVWVDGVRAIDPGHPWAREVRRFERAGALAGTPQEGALALTADGRVLANRAGPLPVPEGGSVVTYPAAARALALAEPGARIATIRRVEPAAFQRPAFALEAGPLLARGGAPAFDPAVEGFARGVRILDEPTSQAAIGRTADGSVLLILAERMTAEDLVPLALALGAVDAMRLDSGGSATLVHDGVSVHRGLERAVANAIALYEVGAP